MDEKPKRIYTYHDGAEQERSAILRFIHGPKCFNLAALEIWIKARKDRYRKRKGGL
jgi:hypothetical protein